MTAASRWHDEGLVFASELGTPLDPGNVRRRFQAVLAAAGLRRRRFHDLRGAYATHALLAGVPLRVVQEQLGHSSPTVTAAAYAAVLPALAQDGAERVEAVIFGGR
jgi:integrase